MYFNNFIKFVKLTKNHKILLRKRAERVVLLRLLAKSYVKTRALSSIKKWRDGWEMREEGYKVDFKIFLRGGSLRNKIGGLWGHRECHLKILQPAIN